jgi:hypothetical protein
VGVQQTRTTRANADMGLATPLKKSQPLTFLEKKILKKYWNLSTTDAINIFVPSFLVCTDM